VRAPADGTIDGGGAKSAASDDDLAVIGAAAFEWGVTTTLNRWMCNQTLFRWRRWSSGMCSVSIVCVCGGGGGGGGGGKRERETQKASKDLQHSRCISVLKSEELI
jgi:hypothetical protein